MSAALETRTSELIAAEIQGIKSQAADVILRSSVEIGRRLVEAKEVVPHGEWGRWLEVSVDYSQSTANNLMAIYREYGDKLQTLGNLSYTKALALLGVPEEERAQFVEGHDVDGMSARELQQAVKDKQRLEKELKETTAKAAELEKRSKEHGALVSKLSADLEAAKLSGNDDEARRLQEELRTSQSRVTQLEKELKAKPIDVPGVVERVPEAVEQELAELRRKVASKPSGQASVKFTLCFEQLVRTFSDTLAALGEVAESDAEAHAKYKAAVAGLVGKMQERL